MASRWATLWTHKVSATYAYPGPAQLGPDGAPGILVIAATEQSQGDQNAGTVSVTLDVLALSGSGQQLWEHTDQGQVEQSAAGTTETNLPTPTGLLRANSDQSTDVLVDLEDLAAAPTGDLTTHATAEILSGADGSSISSGTMDDTNREPVPFTIGDVSGDGLQDYAFVSAGQSAPGTVSARSGVSGQEVWNDANVPVTAPAFLTDGGEGTGDGKPEVLVSSFGAAFSGSGPGGGTQSPDTFLLDGGDGHVLWSKYADIATPLGDVNADGKADVSLITSNDGSRLGIRYQAVDASGSAIYSKTYSVPIGNGNGSSSESLSSEIGDLDGDGIPDFQHALVAVNTDTGRSHVDRGYVSGRTGDKLWPGTNTQPLFAAVDGHGDDVARIKRVRPRVQEIFALRGDTGSLLWARRLRVHRKTDGFALGVDMTGDGKAEVLVQLLWPLKRSVGTRAVMLGSNFGKVLWSRRS